MNKEILVSLPSHLVDWLISAPAPASKIIEMALHDFFNGDPKSNFQTCNMTENDNKIIDEIRKFILRNAGGVTSRNMKRAFRKYQPHKVEMTIIALEKNGEIERLDKVHSGAGRPSVVFIPKINA